MLISRTKTLFSYFNSTLLLVIFLSFNSVLLAQDIFTTSFEDYVTSSVNGQGNWKISSGSANVLKDSTLAYTGLKSLNFKANNETMVVDNISFTGSQQGVTGIVYVDIYVKINSMLTKDFAISGYDLFGGSEKRTFVLEFDTPSGSTGDFRIYNGSSKLKIGTYSLGNWYRISARIDYEREVYQVIFNGMDAVSAGFRESYTPSASGSRPAGIKEYHEMRFNLGYNGAQGSVDALVDDIYVSTNPIDDIEFPKLTISYTVDIEQPDVGSILIDPEADEYPDSTEITVTLDIPDGYKNAGWTGDLSGTELVKTFLITKNMQIGAEVVVDSLNPPPQYTVNVTQPAFGSISLDPPGGVYFAYTNVTAKLILPVGYINEGWTGDLSGTETEKRFTVLGNMSIGAVVVQDTTPPNVYQVSTSSELKNVCKGSNLKPGDIVEVADGNYDSGGITVESSGLPGKPIIIRAKNIGGAVLTGSTYFTFRKNEYLVLEGFHFTSAKYTVVKLEGCNNIRITRNTFQLTETEGQSGKWVYIGGYWNDGSILSHHNRVDHNIFRDKHQLGNFITIDGGDNVSQHDRIDHNYFYNIGPRHENEMEAIRVGWSELSLTDGFTVIEYNLFEDCDGDPEIISIKSCKDTVRYNTFKSSQGTVSLRHGDGSVVHDNYFLGEGKEGTGGIRIYARNHKIYNNYFEGLTGSKWDAAITLTNGDTDTGSLSAHWRIDNVIIANNTLVNNFSNIEIGYAKSDNSWKKEPRNVTMANNLVLGSETDIIKQYNAPSNFTWTRNIMHPQNGASLGITVSEDQISEVDPQLVYVDSLWVLSPQSPAIDASDNSVLDIEYDMQGQARIGIPDVGADEYSTALVIRKPLTIDNVGPFAEDSVVSVVYNGKPIASYNLFRNYPNPFNPSTVFEYNLSAKTHVSLDIYNALGQKVSSVVNEVQNSGVHKVSWNANELSSGVYIATIRTRDRMQSLKVLLIK